MEDEGFYTEERWDNWMERIRDESFDPEDEDSALLFFNLQDDVTIACANAVDAYDDGEVDEDEFMEELDEMRNIVMREEQLGDDKGMILEGVQTSLIAVLAACETYVTNGAPEDDAPKYVEDAVDAERADEMDRALMLVAQAGACILDDGDFDATDFAELEYGFVSEWVNGLDSLAKAMSEPETIDED